jgi:nitroreductase
LHSPTSALDGSGKLIKRRAVDDLVRHDRKYRRNRTVLNRDTGFTAPLMLLAAVDEGLGALFFGIVPHQIAEFRELFGVPETYLPIGAVAIGHPDAASDKGGSAKVIKRRTLDDLVHRGRW